MTDDELDRALILADPLEGTREGDFDFVLAEEELLAEILAAPSRRDHSPAFPAEAVARRAARGCIRLHRRGRPRCPRPARRE